MPRFDPFICSEFSDRTRIRCLHFVSGSLASCLDSIPLFSFGFSGILPEFDPFFLFRVLRHRSWVRFGFSCILPGFDPFVLFQVLWHRAQISLFSPTLFPDSSSSLELCPDFIIFFGIVSGFPYHHRHHVRITHLPRHHAWVSLSPSVVATQFL